MNPSEVSSEEFGRSPPSLRRLFIKVRIAKRTDAIHAESNHPMRGGRSSRRLTSVGRGVGLSVRTSCKACDATDDYLSVTADRLFERVCAGVVNRRSLNHLLRG